MTIEERKNYKQVSGVQVFTGSQVLAMVAFLTSEELREDFLRNLVETNLLPTVKVWGISGKPNDTLGLSWKGQLHSS